MTDALAKRLAPPPTANKNLQIAAAKCKVTVRSLTSHPILKKKANKCAQYFMVTGIMDYIFLLPVACKIQMLIWFDVTFVFSF